MKKKFSNFLHFPFRKKSSFPNAADRVPLTVAVEKLPESESKGVDTASIASIVPPIKCSTLPDTGKCPFKHGTVYAHPYPGYVHGNPKKGVCPNGCRPQMNCDITDHETPKETLIREAIEFLELYYHERYDEMKGTAGFISKEERINSVRNSIETTGTYMHTFDELQHGARVAWRNAPKCSNRKYWQNLKLIDCRGVSSNKGMYDCCLDHLTKAMSCGSSEAYISVFRQAKQGTLDGPRIWNDQLLQYAAYMDDGNVMGDQKNLRFTQMLEERFGWNGPKSGEQGPYDYLPLIVQADPYGKPELFDMPIEFVPHVHIQHPEHPELSFLDLRWYPIPAVCALDLTLGGIVYTAAPFNGWYADTEVLRDLIDEDRYNLLAPIAQALGIYEETKSGEAPFYKDQVIFILSKAIYHSFKTAKVTMIDHHNLIDTFWGWYKSEMLSRMYCSVNWKWVIPPVAASTNRAYLGLSKAQEYTLKPAYIAGKKFIQLENATFGKRSLDNAYKSLLVTIRLLIFLKRWVKNFRERKQPVLIICASVTGNSTKHAGELAHLLRQCSNITFFDACGANAALDEDIMHHLRAASLVIFVISTQGNGEIPSLSAKFFSFLFGENRHLLTSKKTAVLAFGSSAYPIFCGAGAYISNMLEKYGATEVVPRANCDAVKGEATTFFDWTCKLVEKWACLNPSSALVQQLVDKIKTKKEASLMQVEELLKTINIEIICEEELNEAAISSVKEGRRRLDLSVSGHCGRHLLLDSSSHGLSRNFENLQVSGHGLHRSSNGYALSMSSSVHDYNSVRSIDTSMSREDVIKDILMGKLAGFNSDNATYEGKIISREEMIKTDAGDGRRTSLIKIDLEACGSPPYQPGDHARIYPRNMIDEDKMKFFLRHLSGDLGLDDQIYAWNRDETKTNLKEVKVASPLLHSIIGSMTRLRDLLDKEMAVHAPISMHACLKLSKLATNNKDATLLQTLGSNETEYASEVSNFGLKWINMFDRFKSLSQQVDIALLLCYAKKNHVRSYSIASCKEIVGNEVHLVVGRYLYTRGDTQQVGVCSNYLTSREPGDYMSFKLESVRSFHLPSNPAYPTIFICTGTGFAPMRGLLQKRHYFQSRGEKLGPAYLIFGTRSSEERFFCDEVKAFEEMGVLTSAFLCYSREPGKKREYTTDKLRDEVVQAIIAPILAQSNSHVFICGSASMAEECKSALKIISSVTCIDNMVDEGRLHCDVFGLVTNSNRKSPATATRPCKAYVDDNDDGED